MTNARRKDSENKDKEQSSTQVELNDLPCWRLDALYKGIADPQIEKDLHLAREGVSQFSQAYKGRLSTLSPADLGCAVCEYERLQERIARLGVFAFLKHAENLSDGTNARFRQGLQEQLTEIEKSVLFFSLELNGLDDDALRRACENDSSLSRYVGWLQALRRFKPHQLSEDMEELLAEKSLTARLAWITLYDESEALMRFRVGDEEIVLSEVLHKLSDEEASVRRAAAHALGKGLSTHLPLLTTITNTLAQDKALEDKRRGFGNPIEARNLDNRIEGDVVAALVSSVRAFYPRLSHRYYRLKARWMGFEQLDYWDRLAPVPNASRRFIPWREARATVRAAYGGFSSELGALAERFFDNPWIDAAPRTGKMSGAFSCPCVPETHPVILMSYRGRTRDVMTLAHEMGHAIHQTLAAKQGFLLSQTPLTLAETASVFGERLTFDLMLTQASSLAEKRALLAGKIEDMLNTVVRQIAFLDFEQKLHERRRKAPLSSDEIGDLWMQTARESLGDVFRFDEHYRCYWGYVSHFIHAPFYVYAYAFGDGLVNVLYALYRDGMADFEQRYKTLLAAGGSRDYKELLAAFSLDPAAQDFWQRGLLVIEGMIDQLQNLLDEDTPNTKTATPRNTI